MAQASQWPGDVTANGLRMTLTSRDSVLCYFDEIAGLLVEYDEKRIDPDRLVLTVKNLTLGVQVKAHEQVGGYTAYLETSDTDEVSETGTGFAVTPNLATQPADDAGKVAASIRAVLGEPDAL